MSARNILMLPPPLPSSSRFSPALRWCAAYGLGLLVMVAWVVFVALVYRARSDGFGVGDHRYMFEDLMIGAFLGCILGRFTASVFAARFRLRSPGPSQSLHLFVVYLVYHLTALVSALTIMVQSFFTQDDFIVIIMLSALALGGLVALVAPEIANPGRFARWHALPASLAILGLLACLWASGGVWLGNTGWGKAWNHPWYLFILSLAITLVHGAFAIRSRGFN